MAKPIDKASSFRFGVALGDNLLGLFAEDIDPRVVGYAAPVQSQILSPTHGTFMKVGIGDKDWSKTASVTGVGYYSFGGGAVRTVNDGDYLEQGGVGMNLVPFVVPFESQIIALSAATSESGTWRLMVQYLEGSVWTDTPAFIDVVESDYASQEWYDLALPAGTRMAMQVQNSEGNISKPRGFAFLKKV